MKLCLFLISFIVYAKGCARTTGTVTTTLSPTTGTITTTVSPTTTTTLACMKCTGGSFNPNTPDPTAPGNPDVHGATIATGMDANGCSTLTVTCTAAPGKVTTLAIYLPNGTPLQTAAPAPVLMQTLGCTDGQWTFTANDANGTPITEIIAGASCLDF